jgi:hypothetical protein
MVSTMRTPCNALFGCHLAPGKVVTPRVLDEFMKTDFSYTSMGIEVIFGVNVIITLAAQFKSY